MLRGSLFLLLTTCMVTSSFAEANSRLRERTLRLSERVADMVSRNINALNEYELEEIQQRLREVGQIVRGQDPGRPPLPPDRPRLDLFEAECHIDDDPDFTHGQSVVGRLRADTVEDLALDCQAIARSTYGANSSSGLLRLTPDFSRLPFGYQTAECHIDDDAEFTSGQLVVGTVAGVRITDVIRECVSVSQTAYNGNGSAGLLKLNEGRQVPRGMKSATCEIDDDPDFTPGQTTVGTLWAYSVVELTQDCQAIAKHVYGASGSSGIKDLR